MISVCNRHEGELPLLISVPHDGVHIPADIRKRMTSAGVAVQDTDWHVAEVYDFARDLGASMLVANYSRYVVDLNRSSGDDVLYPGLVATGLCPEKTFGGDDIYREDGVSEKEQAARIERYWQPYHDQVASMLEEMRARHGYALLWDAHSIPSVVPRLFDGELPELNIGTNGGQSCEELFQDRVVAAAKASPFSIAVNGRFKGGYITRHYGEPDAGIHAIQLEIAQRAYMDESTTAFDAARAARLRETLRDMLMAFSAR